MNLFVSDAKKQGDIRTAVLGHPPYNNKMKYGLWTLCRHPNYFFEWCSWNSFCLMALPSALALAQILLKAFRPKQAFLCCFTARPGSSMIASCIGLAQHRPSRGVCNAGALSRRIKHLPRFSSRFRCPSSFIIAHQGGQPTQQRTNHVSDQVIFHQV